MLDLIGSVVGMMAVAVNLVAVTTVLNLSLAKRLWLAAIAGAWVGLASSLGATGDFVFSPDRPLPLVGVCVATPLLVVGFFAIAYRDVRSALMAIPMHVLIGLNVLRILGVMFLLLAAAGRLSGPFPFSAGFGDIITGVFAARFAMMAARSETPSIAAVKAWNWFGALDLFVAIGLGLTSAAGSPMQWIHAGVGSQAMQLMPFCLVPTVLVPFYLITHAIVAAQLAAHRESPAIAVA